MSEVMSMSLDCARECGLPGPQTPQSTNLAALRRDWTEAVAQSNSFRGSRPGKHGFASQCF